MLTVLCCAATGAACYTFVPVESPAPGTTVRANVHVRSALSGSNGTAETASVEGMVVSAGDSLVLEARNLVQLGAYRDVVQVDTFRIPSTELASIEEQQFSAPKTIGLSVLIAGGTAFLAATALGLTGGESGGGKGGDPPVNGQVILKPLIGAVWRLAVR